MITTATTTRVTAHRGDCARHRENTLPAIRSAVEKGADLVEFDLRVTADGEVIVLHDATLDRLWGVARPVADVTLADVVALGDPDHRPPRLAEVLAAMEGGRATALIDVTDAGIVGPAMEVVRSARTAVTWCGDRDAMRVVRLLDPRASIWMPWDRVAPPTVGDIADLRPDAVNVPGYVVTPALADGVHALGLRLAAWTIDEPAIMRAMIAAGVDLVTTNRMSVLQRVIDGEDDMTDSTPYARERAVARGLAEWAIEYTRAADPGEVRTKADGADIVTDVDVAVERYVREVVGAHFPDHDFVGEELGGAARPGVPCWYLDPVDGTANFANRVPWTAFSLALVVDGRPVVGVVADPWREDLFEAEAGAGARLNGAELDLAALPAPETGVDPLRGRVVGTELANQFPWPGMLPMLEALGARDCTMRVMGSGTLTIAGVAAGRGVGAVIGRFGPVDHLAAVLIVSEAGGVVRDESGAECLFPGGGGIMASVPAAADALHAVWSRSLGAAGAGGRA